MIELLGLGKDYDGVPAVRELDLTVAQGELCALIGPSGCGKSTTLRLINRLLEPTRGTVRIDGRDTRTMRPALLRRRIGYVIQSVGLFPHLTVAENIGVVPRLLGWNRGRREARADELLQRVGLDPGRYRAKRPRELSGGEAQRVGVARALAADPPILLMDEPFGAVDPLTREVLQGEFLHLQQELRKTVVFVTHDLDEAVRLADRIVLMRAGRIVQATTPESLLAHPANTFVRNFVGTDRALKRLARFQVGPFMAPAPSVGAEERLPLPSGGAGARFLWVTSGDGRLLGWLDRQAVVAADPSAGSPNTSAGSMATVGEAMTPVDPAETAVRVDSTLKAALSRMLGQGIRTVPVVDEQGRLVGQLGLQEIERLTTGDSVPGREAPS